MSLPGPYPGTELDQDEPLFNAILDLFTCADNYRSRFVTIQCLPGLLWSRSRSRNALVQWILGTFEAQKYPFMKKSRSLSRHKAKPRPQCITFHEFRLVVRSIGGLKSMSSGHAQTQSLLQKGQNEPKNRYTIFQVTWFTDDSEITV